MSIFKKIFKPASPPPPQLFRQLPNGGGYVFDPNLVANRIVRRTGTPTREEVNEASQFIWQAIHEIGEGKELAEYDTMAIVTLPVVQAWAMLGAGDSAILLLFVANTLYERYSIDQKMNIDRALAGFGAGAFLVAKVYRILGAGHPTPEQLNLALDLLERTTRQIEGRATQQDEQDSNLIGLYKTLRDEGVTEPLTHDDVSRGYKYLAMQLRTWGEHDQAWEIMKKNLLTFEFYRTLSNDERIRLREWASNMFPENFPELKAKIFEPHEQMIQLLRSRSKR